MKTTDDHRHSVLHGPWVFWGRGLGLLALGALLAGCGWLAPQAARARLEGRWEEQGHCLVLIPFAVPDEAAARTVRFDWGTLRTHRLYLRSRRDPVDYLHIADDGTVQRAGHTVGRLVGFGELFLAEDRVTLYVDGQRLTDPSSDWEVLWESAEEQPPALTSTMHPGLDVVDGFMRQELVSAPCAQATGDIALAQHGGGMARDES